MEWSFVFFLNSALLGVGLAMDAFSVSMANGLHDPRMSRGTMCRIAGTFALFQAVMPMTCLLYTSPSPRDGLLSRMPSSA